MVLDVTTLLAVSAIVILTSSGMFIAEAWARTGAAVDRLWSLAFASAIMTALAYAATALEPGMWWVNAVGNGSSVLTVWAMWSGIRAYGGARSFIWLTLAAAGLTALAALLGGPDGGAWAGGEAVLGGTAAGALLAAGAIVRGPLRRFRTGVTLGLILLVAGAYYLLRLVVFVAVGPTARVFETYVGTEVTTIVMTVLVNGAAFAAVTLRGQQAREHRTGTHSFDPMTGARTRASFVARARREVAAAEAAGQPVSLVAIAPEELRAIAVAFGQASATDALVACGEVALAHSPAHSVVGRDGQDGHTFLVLLPGRRLAEAVDWATQVRKELIDVALEVPGSRVRVTASIGVSTGEECGFDLEAMRAGATAAAREALARGGNRVLGSADLPGH